MDDFINRLTKMFPKLPGELRMAHIKERPQDFVKKRLIGSMMYSVMIGVAAFLFMAALKLPIVYAIISIPLLFFLMFLLLIRSPITKINKRKRDLEREVLFAGRFLLVKIHSGRPLLNALVDASQSYGVASKYFRELVDDINMGTAIEKALDNAMSYSPSPKYSKILFQISNAIKIGIDVSEPLANTLDEISQQQMIEIQRYGKKLNSLSIFYMLIAVVMPSIGVAMFSVIGSLVGFGEFASAIFMAVLVFLAFMQMMFIMIFKSARLTVNL